MTQNNVNNNWKNEIKASTQLEVFNEHNINKNQEKYIYHNNGVFYRNNIDVVEELIKLKKIFPDFNEVIDYFIHCSQLSNPQEKFIFQDIVILCDDIYYVNYFIKTVSLIIYNKTCSLSMIDFNKDNNYKTKLKDYTNNQIINLKICDDFFSLKGFEKNFYEFYNCLNKSFIYSDYNYSYNLIYSLNYKILKNDFKNCFSTETLEKNLDSKSITSIFKKISETKEINDSYFNGKEFFLENKKIFLIKRNRINTFLNYLYENILDILNLKIEKIKFTPELAKNLIICFEDIQNIEHIFKNILMSESSHSPKTILNCLKIMFEKNDNYEYIKINNILNSLNENEDYNLLISNIKNFVKKINLYDINKISTLDFKLSETIKTKLIEKEIEVKTNIKQTIELNINDFLLTNKNELLINDQFLNSITESLFNSLIYNSNEMIFDNVKNILPNNEINNLIKTLFNNHNNTIINKFLEENKTLNFSDFQSKGNEISKLIGAGLFYNIQDFVRKNELLKYQDSINLIDKSYQEFIFNSIKTILFNFPQEILPKIFHTIGTLSEIEDFDMTYIKVNLVSTVKNIIDNIIPKEKIDKYIEILIDNLTLLYDKDEKDKNNNDNGKLIIDNEEKTIENEQPIQNYHTTKIFNNLSQNLTKEDNSLLEEYINKIKINNGIRKIKLIENEYNIKISQLKEEFPNFKNYLDHLEQELVVKKITTNELLFKPTLFVGDTGIGKTYFIMKLAKIFDIKSYICNLSTVETSRALFGCNSTWSNSQPGLNFANNDIVNNIIILDELDKGCSSSVNTVSIQDSLLPLLETETAKKFRDQFIDVEFDASKAIYIATVNDLDLLSETIKNRFQIFEIPSPNNEEKQIIGQHIYRNLLQELKLTTQFTPEININILRELMIVRKISCRELKNIIYSCICQTIKQNNKENDLFKITDNCVQSVLENIVIYNENNDGAKINKNDYHLIKIFNKSKKLNSYENYYENKLLQKYTKMLKNDNGFKKIKLIPNDFTKKLLRLREEFPNFNNYIDFIEQELSIKNITTKEFLLSPSLLVGSAGVGKTYFVMKLAECFGIRFYNCNLSSTDSSSTLTGNSSNWSNSKPGMIFENFVENEIVNNLMLLDELDKAINITNSHISIQNTLLTLLEKETAKCYKDQFIDIEFNATYVNFIATANNIDDITSPLINRMRVFEIYEPNKSEKEKICQNIYKHLLEDLKLIELFNNKLEPTVITKLVNTKIISNRELKNLIHNSIGKAIINKNKKNNLFFISENEIVDINNKKTNIGFI